MRWGPAYGELPTQAPRWAGQSESRDGGAVQFLLRERRLSPASDATFAAVSGPEGLLCGDRVARAGLARGPDAGADAQTPRALPGKRADGEALDPFLA